MKTIMLVAIVFPVISRGIAASDDTTATATVTNAENGSGIQRLDLSVPDLPALVDLNLSTEKVTRPSTPQEFATALASGFSADGSFHNGVAIEVAPFGLAGVESAHARALRVSLATAAVSSNGVTSGKAAVGLRYSYGAYDPLALTPGDRLRTCLADQLPRASAAPDTGPLPDPGVSRPIDSATAKKVNEGLQGCRDRARAAHLAQSIYEIAAVVDGTSEGNLKLYDLGQPHTSAWISISHGWNSYSFDPKTAPRGAWGFQPTVMVRLDTTKIMTGTQKDLFAGLRFPLGWDSFGIFAELGFTRTDLSKVQSSGGKSTTRVGGGLEYRLGNGRWFGLYVGEDFGDSSGFSFLSNVRFQLGEDRPYGVR
jgi:hypothetical protein